MIGPIFQTTIATLAIIVAINALKMAAAIVAVFKVTVATAITSAAVDAASVVIVVVRQNNAATAGNDVHLSKERRHTLHGIGRLLWRRRQCCYCCRCRCCDCCG